jgi:hypothetical protein
MSFSIRIRLFWEKKKRLTSRQKAKEILDNLLTFLQLIVLFFLKILLLAFHSRKIVFNELRIENLCWKIIEAAEGGKTWYFAGMI